MQLLYSYNDRWLHAILKDGSTKSWYAPADVRNDINGKRPLHVPEQVVWTKSPDKYVPSKPYMPQHFPQGTWNVLCWIPSSAHYLRPGFLHTDAERSVQVWALDEHGGYDHPTQEWVWDTAYEIHWPEGPWTQGCIGVEKEASILELRDEYFKALTRGENVTLTV